MCHTLSFFFRSSRPLDPAVVLVTDSGSALRMCGHAVALVCILFLSTSALVTRSPLPSPRARVCTLRCVRVRSCRSRCSYSLCGHLGRPGSGYVLFCPRFHSSCLPFAFASSLPPTPYVPVLPPSVVLSLSTAVSFLYVLLLFYDIPYLCPRIRPPS